MGEKSRVSRIRLDGGLVGNREILWKNTQVSLRLGCLALDAVRQFD